MEKITKHAKLIKPDNRISQLKVIYHEPSSLRNNQCYPLNSLQAQNL